jgi:hypothetical protein
MINYNKENEYMRLYHGALKAMNRLSWSTLVTSHRIKRDLERIKNEIDKNIKILEDIINDDGVTN